MEYLSPAYPMDTNTWIEKHVVAVPDDAIIFVRHPRHFVMKVGELGWVRYHPDDIEQDAPKVAAAKFDPERIAETVVSLSKLMETPELQNRFMGLFPVAMRRDEQTRSFGDADQILVKVSGGNSWFVWGLKGETL